MIYASQLPHPPPPSTAQLVEQDQITYRWFSADIASNIGPFHRYMGYQRSGGRRFCLANRNACVMDRREGLILARLR